MKKRFILTLVVVSSLFTTTAQTYFNEDFENGNQYIWSTIDADSDGNTWQYQYPYGNNFSTGATSYSWQGGTVLTPDNWLVSPSVDLSSAGVNTILDFWWLGLDEHLSVYISTSGNTIADFTGVNGDTLIDDFVTTDDNTYHKISLALGLYAGQTVYIAFRHHNSTNQFNLGIDDIKIYEDNTIDLQLTAIENRYTKIPKDQINPIFPLSIVKNNGITYSDNFNIDFTITNETYNESVAVSVPLNHFEVDTVETLNSFLPVSGTYEIVSKMTPPNDGDDSNDSSTYYLTITDDILSYNSGSHASQMGINTGGYLGNKFVIDNNDTLTGVEFHIVSGAVPHACKVEVYDFTNNTIGALLTETISINLTDQDSIYKKQFLTPVLLTPGQEIIIAVNNSNAGTFLNLGTDTRYYPNTSFTSNNGTSFSEISIDGFNVSFEIDAVLGTFDSIPYDIALTSIDIQDGYELNDNVEIKGTIRNMSNMNTLTSFDVTYIIDGGTPSTIYNVTPINVAVFDTYQFTHNITWTASNTGTHTIEVTISNPNGNTDENLVDNVLSTNFKVVNELFPKTIVYEEATGTWCGWCVRGIVGLNKMEEQHENDNSWIGIAVHGGGNDPMGYTTYTNGLGIAAYPGGKMNRNNIDVEPRFDDLQEAYDIEITKVPVAKIEITNQTWNSSTRNFTIDVSTTFALDINAANFNTALIVLENNVSGTASVWSQANYYSGGSEDLIDVDGSNYKNLSDPVPASDMVYNHVARQLVDGWDGTATIPVSVTYNTLYTHTYSGSIPANNDATHTLYVAVVIDNSTGKIVNATEIKHVNYVSVNENLALNSDLTVYPNPTNGMLMINGIENINPNKIIIYNLLGEIVFNKTINSTTNQIDLSNLNNGNYILQVISDEKTISKQIVISK